MKRIISTLLIMIITAISVIGCSSSNSTSTSSNAKILFCISNASDVFLGTLITGAQEYADSNQLQLSIVDAKNDVETQASQIKAAKSEGYTAIICNLVDADTALQMIASADGLPIVFINRKPEETLLKKNQYIYVGSDENVAGALQAEYLVSLFKGKSVNAVVFKGEKGHPAAEARTEAVKATLKDAGVDVTYVFEDTAVWSFEKAKSMFITFLNTKRPFDCVICNNDEMALGVIEACKEKGIDPSSFPIVGIDGIEKGCKAIADKTMAFTVYQSASGQGKNSVEAALALSKGKSIKAIEYSTEEKNIIIPFEGIKFDNVKNYLK